ncbi:DNA-binding XRE family transcriptional regulator [Trinickia symbiotica]|uniref:helix-turn-helix domain-containing protein n=1 Tax=Trinickia symbiotica TaxID=863227 RepID=UPI000D4833F5|nr:helix-turn-helix domain-containing protein [Trinickia symbiotica]PPK41030.1 DNA-binding XRE family transcriptional regulator [Trinickia symbiotica]
MENEETNIEPQADKPVPQAHKPLDPVCVELVKARKKAGMTQQELHLKTGISRDTIKGYETGRSVPGTRELRALCEALGISANRALWGREDFQEPATDAQGRVISPAAHQYAQSMKLMAMLNMVSKEEAAAVLTLLEGIIVGRHGKKEMEKAFAVLEVIGQEMGKPLEEAIERGMTDERVAQLSAKVEAAATRRRGKQT